MRTQIASTLKTKIKALPLAVITVIFDQGRYLFKQYPTIALWYVLLIYVLVKKLSAVANQLVNLLDSLADSYGIKGLLLGLFSPVILAWTEAKASINAKVKIPEKLVDIAKQLALVLDSLANSALMGFFLVHYGRLTFEEWAPELYCWSKNFNHLKGLYNPVITEVGLERSLTNPINLRQYGSVDHIKKILEPLKPYLNKRTYSEARALVEFNDKKPEFLTAYSLLATAVTLRYVQMTYSSYRHLQRPNPG